MKRTSAHDQIDTPSEVFLQLLVTPLATTATHPDLVARCRRHRDRLTEWCGRLGYRMVLSASSVRVHRDPRWPLTTAAPPARNPPHRRELVLTLLAAVVCEEVNGTTTLQELADETRALSAAADARVTPYDPDNNSRSERRLFRAAVRRLVELGVLLSRTTDESMARRWEEEGTGFGEGYEVDSEALLQFSDPYTVSQVLSPGPATEEDADQQRSATRSVRMLRHLVEDTALLYADLAPSDAEYARAQRTWLARIAIEMTGGTAEIREEGLVLRLPPDSPAAQAATFAFPQANATHWFTLGFLARVSANAPPVDQRGCLSLSSEEVDQVFEALSQEHPRALVAEIRTLPKLRSAVAAVLTALGVLRVDESGHWTLLPTAGRWRSPRTTWEPVPLGHPAILENPVPLDDAMSSDHSEENSDAP